MASTFGDNPRESNSKSEQKDFADIFVQCIIFAEVVMKPSLSSDLETLNLEI